MTNKEKDLLVNKNNFYYQILERLYMFRTEFEIPKELIDITLNEYQDNQVKINKNFTQEELKELINHGPKPN